MDSVSPCPQPSVPVHVADSVHESSVISLQPSDRMMAAAENAHLPVLALFKSTPNLLHSASSSNYDSRLDNQEAERPVIRG